MKYLLLALIFVSCSTPSEPKFNTEFIEYKGYISNTYTEPKLFTTTEDSTFFIYNYNNFDSMRVRANRKIVVEHKNGYTYFIAEIN